MRYSVNETKAIQVQLLVIISFLISYFSLPTLNINVVSNTYLHAAKNFWAGNSPYIEPDFSNKLDYFMYSPFFSMVYGIFFGLKEYTYIAFWQALNAVFFWYGLSKWHSMNNLSSFLYLLPFLACFMELDTAIKFHQVNPLLIGMILMGLAAYRDEKFFLSGFLLMLVTNIKVLPAIFLFPLFFPPKSSYIKGALTGFVLTFFSPVIFLGFQKWYSFHIDWFQILYGNIVRDDLLDIKSALIKIHINESLAEIIKNAIFLVSFFCIALCRLVKNEFPWSLWISFAVCCILLLSPGTEVATFVLVGPVYLLIAGEIDKMTGLKRITAWLASICGQIAITFLFSWISGYLFDIDWKDSKQPTALSKSFGVLGLWFMSLIFLIHRFYHLKTKHYLQSKTNSFS